MSHIEKEAISIILKLRENNHEAFFVGGCVRDRLLGKDIHDIDITTSAPPEEVAKIFPRTLNVGAKFGVMVVLQNNQQFEVATFRNDGIYIDGRRPQDITFSTAQEDVKRRDFTINGLLLDPIKNEIIDYVDGQNDLKNKIIRAIGDPIKRFEEDHLRMLRALRFAARFNFTLEKKTYLAITTLKEKIAEISRERITEELTKMLDLPQKVQAINLLLETGLYEIIFSELKIINWQTIKTYLTNFQDVTITSLLWLLLTKTTDSSQIYALLPAHEFKKKLLTLTQKCLCLSNNQVNQIENLQQAVSDLTSFKTFSNAKKIRFFLNPEFQNALYLYAHQIECDKKDPTQFLSFVQKDHEELMLKKGIERLPDALLDGNEIMALQIKPGPILKTIKETLIDLQLEELIVSKKDAIKFVTKNYKTKLPDKPKSI